MKGGFYMLEFSQEVTVDLNVELTNGVLDSVHVNQYEHNSRQININVKKDGIAYTIPADLTVNLRIHKSNGYDIYKTIGKDIGSINENIITIPVDESITIASGRQTCDIEFKDSSGSILYSTKFYINVHKSALDDNAIKDCNDYSTVQSLARESKEYANMSKSYAVGGTQTRIGEDDDNAKYYSEISQTNAALSESWAHGNTGKREDETTNNAKYHSENSQTNALLSKSYAVGGTQSRDGESTDNAKYFSEQSSNSADTSQNNATLSKSWAVGNTNIRSDENINNAKHYSELSSTSAEESKSYAVGGTGTRENETVDNAKYYYEQSKSISESFSGALRPMGTVAFTNLPSISDATEGDMYNVSDEFTTTASFKEGAGYIYPAGTNVYKTADGYWDCLAGTMVTGIKGNAENSYRKGNINLTSENIGALPTSGGIIKNNSTTAYSNLQPGILQVRNDGEGYTTMSRSGLNIVYEGHFADLDGDSLTLDSSNSSYSKACIRGGMQESELYNLSLENADSISSGSKRVATGGKVVDYVESYASPKAGSIDLMTCSRGTFGTACTKNYNANESGIASGNTDVPTGGAVYSYLTSNNYIKKIGTVTATVSVPAWNGRPYSQSVNLGKTYSNIVFVVMRPLINNDWMLCSVTNWTTSTVEITTANWYSSALSGTIYFDIYGY